MGKFAALADAVGDALAAFAAAEIETPADLNEIGQAVALWTADAAYALQRVAERVEQTAISDTVVSRFRAAAAGQRVNAALIRDELDYPLVTQRR